jgi:hypothetical protein
MTQKLGRLLTCDRCGREVFEPKREAVGDEGWRSDCIYFVETPGWVSPSDYRLSGGSFVNGGKVLCPECEGIRMKVMDEFWHPEKQESPR